MGKNRPKLLSIAGFDPSGGAGILADIKTFEQFRCQSFSVCTSITYQHESRFDGLDFLPWESVEKQLSILAEKYQMDVVKIGLIKDLDFLLGLIASIKVHFPKAIIVWDPIVKASAGYTFWKGMKHILSVMRQVDYITPNWEEGKILFEPLENEDLVELIKSKGLNSKIILKGGHNPEKQGVDYLITNEQVYPFNPKRTDVEEKHGSGCIFSAALSANIANGYTDIKAVIRAKKYTIERLMSNNSLLAYHK